LVAGRGPCDRINVTQRPGEQLPVLFYHIVVART
jgi:hypothetical protein